MKRYSGYSSIFGRWLRDMTSSRSSGWKSKCSASQARSSGPGSSMWIHSEALVRGALSAAGCAQPRARPRAPARLVRALRAVVVGRRSALKGSSAVISSCSRGALTDCNQRSHRRRPGRATSSEAREEQQASGESDVPGGPAAGVPDVGSIATARLRTNPTYEGRRTERVRQARLEHLHGRGPSSFAALDARPPRRGGFTSGAGSPSRSWPAFLALLTYGLLSKGTDDRIDQALARAPGAAPAFSLEVLEHGELPPRLERSLGPALADGRLSLADLRGTPVVLNLWASWCTPCREEARRLERGWRRSGPRESSSSGLDIQDLRGNAHDFIGKYGADLSERARARARCRQRAMARRASPRPTSSIAGVASSPTRGGPSTDRQLRVGLAAARTGLVAAIK